MGWMGRRRLSGKLVTINSLARMIAFLAKDALLVINDFAAGKRHVSSFGKALGRRCLDVFAQFADAPPQGLVNGLVELRTSFVQLARSAESPLTRSSRHGSCARPDQMKPPASPSHSPFSASDLPLTCACWNPLGRLRNSCNPRLMLIREPSLCARATQKRLIRSQ